MSDDDTLYYDIHGQFGEEPWKYEKAVREQYSLDCIASKVNPVIVRFHPSDNLPKVVTLCIDGISTSIVFEGTILDCEFDLNDGDGVDVTCDSGKVMFHLRDDIKDFLVAERLIAEKLHISLTISCGHATQRGQPCKNKTKHESKRCHYHRDIK